jgi:hypothetical protein
MRSQQTYAAISQGVNGKHSGDLTAVTRWIVLCFLDWKFKNEK